MSSQDIALMAHLMRRAGFGATRSELDYLVSQGYDAVVEELLNPGDSQAMPRTDTIETNDRQIFRNLDAQSETGGIHATDRHNVVGANDSIRKFAQLVF